jgi:hypothetical protein
MRISRRVIDPLPGGVRAFQHLLKEVLRVLTVTEQEHSRTQQAAGVAKDELIEVRASVTHPGLNSAHTHPDTTGPPSG